MSMPPKTTPVGAPSGSREVVECFYCEKSFERYYLKIHTKTPQGYSENQYKYVLKY